MAPLSTELRNMLGRTIVAARRDAEAGAHKALESLTVEQHEPHGSMSLEDRKLRRRLRARGRQLGDVRDKQRGSQAINRLAHEVAYEHWHRMLFARFLAENNLLIHPDHGVAVSLDEIEELARETGEDPRSMAARFAQVLLPQIFRIGDPVLEVSLPPESRQALDRLLDSLPAAVFTADDSLGWTYQYWQTEKKEAVNKSGNKIGADELPAVTQLFTEHYMVLFLYHNTIGAWHAGKVLGENPSLAETAQSEEELRQAMSLHSQDGYDFEYLRFVRKAKKGDEEDTPTGPWRPAAGTFESWPKTAKELKVLDPCCGSGHFLTEGFELVVRLRMDEEKLDLEDAIQGVLTDNLHGLELDPRCTQIAAFTLAQTAWKLAGKPIELPAMHIACSGLAVGSTKAEWTELAGDDDRLRTGMEQLYDLFEQAPELGSLINPKAFEGDLLTADFAELQPLLDQALSRESDDVEGSERAVAAQGMARAAELLARKYTLAITNVPYLGREHHSQVVQDFADLQSIDANGCLSTLMLQRCIQSSEPSGTVATVLPHNWWVGNAYSKFRTWMLKETMWRLTAVLGEEAWQTFRNRGPNTILFVMETSKPSKDHEFFALDVATKPSKPVVSLQSKQHALAGSSRTNELRRMSRFTRVNQGLNLRNRKSRISIKNFVNTASLSEVVISGEGCSSGDNDHFLRLVWELSDFSGWIQYCGPGTNKMSYCDVSQVILWEDGRGELGNSTQARIQNIELWDQTGVLVGRVRGISATWFPGGCFSKGAVLICPKDASDLLPLHAFLSSYEYEDLVRSLDPRVSAATSVLTDVPFDLEHWQKVAAGKDSNGLPEPQSDDPTQWLFHGHPLKAEPATVLQVAVGRLLGYRWPQELNPEMHLADEAREWVVRCNTLKDFADEDGIVCLSATRGERSAADRLRELLSTAFGSDWSSAKERELITVAGDGNRPAVSLDAWLHNKFFEEQCKLFHHRPFVWHIWDGNKDGFHCLVNAHKLTGPDGEGRRTLQAITYSYLGDWIDRQKAEQADGKEGADARLAAAQDLAGQLEKILEGEPPYDLFVRWKPLHEQAIGWEPDINDGVRLNIRPFMNAELRKGGKKGAGILRWKPNITWKKDRGKEPESLRPKVDFPWFWNCNGNGNETDRTNFTGGRQFDGNRWNDLHYSNALKMAASERREEKSKA